jgi:hypothetical protein
MRVLVLGSFAMCACSTMTLRTGVFIADGKPAFQASLEVGPSIYRKHVGVSATSEYGVHADGSGAKGMVAMNVDALVLSGDDDGDDSRDQRAPVVRTGVRLRSAFGPDEDRTDDDIFAFLVRGAAYKTVERDRRGISSCGIEISGGFASVPTTVPAFEANLVVTGRWGIM